MKPLGRLPATNVLHLAIGLPLRNQAELKQLLDDLYNPASPRYHQYLTPTEFTEQFGPTEGDYQALIDFANANGLTVSGTHPNRLLLDVRAPVAAIEKAFHLTMQTYQHPTEARTFYAADTDPSLDLSVPVLDIRGLDNFCRPRPAYRKLPMNKSADNPYAAGSGPSGTYMGYDFRSAYAPGVSLTGSGQIAGLFELDGYDASDITAYENKGGLPSVSLTNILLDGFKGSIVDPGAAVEVSLDIEMIVAMAPGVSSLMVYEAPLESAAPYDELSRMATDDLAKQISSSWVITEIVTTPIPDQLYQELGAQGQSFYQASGDEGAFYNGIFQWSDNPYTIIVGGTTLSTRSAGGPWSSETTWTPFSGGGISASYLGNYPLPSYQQGIDMTTNMGSTTMRNVPDVALTADNIFVIADGNQQFFVGGTSCAAPLWAGFTALINQQAAFNTQPLAGFINPAVYAIGKSNNAALFFHDITTGNNTNSGSPTNFFACQGYDLCTGWGTPTGSNLINNLAPLGLQIPPSSGFVASGPGGGPFSVTSQTYSLTNAGVGSITWSLINTSSWLSASSTAGSQTPGAHASSVTIGLNSVASNLTLGTYHGTVVFTNVTTHGIQGRQFTLVVLPSPPSITSQPMGVSAPGGSSVLFSVIAGGQPPLGYQWQKDGVNLSDGGDLFGSATTTLHIDNIGLSDEGNYSVIVTNAYGSVTSSNAPLVVQVGPVITAQPQNLTIALGQAATFSVSATGTAPLAYQWSVNNSNIPGATSSVFTIPSAQPGNDGLYSVVLSNNFGTVESSNAVLAVAAVVAVGDDSLGQCDVPSSATNVLAVAAGSWHSLALRAGGNVLAWGDDFNGQCDVPAGLSGAIAIAAGGYHSLALTATQTVVGWGANDYGEATPPTNLRNVTAIAAGTWDSLALLANGTVVAWGDDTYGQTNIPAAASNVVAIAAGGSHCLALRADGSVIAWGQDSDGQGDYAGEAEVPLGLINVTSIGAGDYHSAAIVVGGVPVIWGANNAGQCQPPTNLIPLTAIAGGGAHTVAIQSNQTVVAWGNDSSGQCDFSPGLSGITAVAAGESHSLALIGGGGPAAGPPVLAHFGLSGGAFSVMVQTVLGQNYALEYKTSLSDTSWVTSLPSVPGNGGLQTLTDPSANSPQRFYRVRQW